MNKKNLRNFYLKKRHQLKDNGKELKIIDNFINSIPFLKSNSVFITVPIRDEINTFPIIKRALDLGKNVYLPRTNPINKTMELVQYYGSLNELKKGSYGIPEPIGESKTGFVPDLTVVPALAYTIDGYRLGYGGGFYDRFLKNNKTYSVGLIYDELLVPILPTESTDIPVNMVLTPSYLIQTNTNNSQLLL